MVNMILQVPMRNNMNQFLIYGMKEEKHISMTSMLDFSIEWIKLQR